MIALALALVMCTVLTVTAGLLFDVATNNAGDATFKVQTNQSLYAAEGGLDLAYAVIGQVTSSAQLPCGTGALNKSFATAPVTTSTSVSVTYYDTTDTALSCASVQSGSVSPAAAEIVATGTAHNSVQYMEALVKLSTSVIGTVFDKALFSNSTFVGSNNPTVYGYDGNDASIYTNGSVDCGNGFADQGSVIAQGGFTGTNNCTVNGNVIAVGNINLSNSTTIGGNATSTGSTGCSSAGSISMSNSATVDQSAYAYCTISLSNNAVVVQNKVQHDTTLTNPTVETFPSIPEPTGTNDSGAMAAWQSHGYTVVTNNSCSGSGSIYNALSGYTTPTAVVTSCALSWANQSSTSLQTNVAIFSTAGFSMANNTSWQSSSSTVHDVYFIVPSSASGTTTTCSGGNPGITLQNNTAFAFNLNVFFYTPCTLSISNKSSGYGQVYAGTMSISNNFTAHFVPVPNVPDSTGGGQENGPLVVEIEYERQVSTPPSS